MKNRTKLAHQDNLRNQVLGKGPFIYYVSIGLGGWFQKMSIFAYVQYINDAYIVGGWV